MLKVLGKTPSINVRKVLWTCVEIELPFEQADYGSGYSATTTPEFMALNPNGLVPVIVEDEFVLWESNTICRYLAGQAQRRDLLPVAPRGRALVEKWMDWQATELNNSWRYAFMGLVRKSPAHADPAAIAASVESFNRHMLMVEDQLVRTGAYMTGEIFTLADVVIGLSVNRWAMMPINRPTLPAVAAYYDRLARRPGYQVWGCNGLP